MAPILREGAQAPCSQLPVLDQDGMEPIAIIGMATRFPQDATTTENLWKFLLEGRNAHTPFPKDRIDADGHYHPDPEHGGTVSRERETT